MKNVVWTTVAVAVLVTQTLAQDFGPPYAGPQYAGPQYDYGQEYIGVPTPSASEPLFQYDDVEVWKHGWIQENPYEHGYHSYRPYNYKQVFAQAAQSSQWGMPSTMPYSQGYYLRHGHLTGINGDPLPAGQGLMPTPNYNAPGFGNPALGAPSYTDPNYGPSNYQNPANGAPGYPTPAHGMPTSMLRGQPFQGQLSPQQLNNIPGLTQLPGHQFPPQQQPAPQTYSQTPFLYGQPQGSQTISPANFQQFHEQTSAGVRYEQDPMQRAQIRQMLQQPPTQPQLQMQGPNFR